MADKEQDNIGTIYVYCHGCNELIAKCKHLGVAYAAEKAHREVCPTCPITTGKKSYFAGAFPDVELEQDKILITVQGGVAHMISKPLGIEVEIRDYDVEQIDAECDERCKKDDEGDWYQAMIWEEDVECP